MKNKELETKIVKIKSAYNRILGMRATVKSLIVSALAFHLYMSFRYFFHSPADLLLLALIFRFIAFAVVIYICLGEFRQRWGLLSTARWLDDVHGRQDDLYQNTLELQSIAAKSPAVYQIIHTQAIERLQASQIVYPVLFSALSKRIIILIVISLSVLWGINYRQLSSSAREYWLNQFQTGSLITSIEVKPGNISLGRNQDVLIEVVSPLTNVPYRLFYKLENQWREVVMPDGRFLFERLDYSFSYYVMAEQVRSPIYRIEVLDNPAIKRFTLKYHYPAYTRLLPDTDSTSYGNIEALKHTKVMFSIQTNIPAVEAVIKFSNGDILPMQKAGDYSYLSQLTVLEPATYYIQITDALGRKSLPEEKTISVLPDLPPEISIAEPGGDVILNQNMLLPVRIIASDDFGLKNLYLKYQVNEQNLVSTEVQGIINASNLDLDYVLSFQALNLLPGDGVTYWAEIYDNSPELQKAVSQKYKARFPSIEELYKEIENQQQNKKEELKDVLSQSKELQKDFEQKRREMLKDDKVNWEDKKQLENMVKTQEQLADQVDKVAQDYQQLIEKMQNNQALSQETLEKMQKIQDIMQEIDNEQLQKAMEQMQKAMQNLKPEDIKKAMENFKFSLEDFNKQIEQTLKLLESIKKEQAVQKALQISEEMEKMQQALNDKASDKANEASKLAKEQENIAKKLDAVKEQMKEIDKLLDPKADKPAQDMMKELEEMMKQDQLEQDMQESEQSLSENKRSQAQSSGQQAQQKMRKMSRKLKEMKESISSGGSQQMTMALQTAVKELMIFSNKHEDAAGRYKQDPYPIMPELLAGYEGMQLILNKLFANPMVMMFVPPKFFIDVNQTNQSYRDFFTNVNELQYFGLNQNLEGVQKGLNLMAYDLIQALNSSSQGGGSGGGMQSLQQMLSQMGQEQMAMNMLTQQMLQQMQGNGGRMGQAEQQQIQRLAAEQERLTENLKRALQNDPAAQKQGNSLQQLADEMEAISRQLRQNRIDQDLINRQDRILSKLLDAQKSINKREYSQKRKGETAENNDFDRNIPQTDFNLLRKKALLDEGYRAFPKEYQQVIQQYLKTLNEGNK
jgi:hypothetical protein